MVATILNSPRAVAMSVYVIRAFVKMRAELAANATILKRLAEIDKTLLIHDVALREIFEKLRPLLAPPPAPPKPEIPRTAKALPLNGLALVRLANPLAIGVGAPKTAPYSSGHTPPACGRYGDSVPAWYLSRTCLVPVSYLPCGSRSTWEVRDRYEIDAWEARASRAFAAPGRPQGRGWRYASMAILAQPGQSETPADGPTICRKSQMRTFLRNLRILPVYRGT